MGAVRFRVQAQGSSFGVYWNYVSAFVVTRRLFRRMTVVSVRIPPRILLKETPSASDKKPFPHPP